MEPLVGIIIGSDSDLGVMSKTAEILDKLEIPYEFSIISAHRTPDRMYEYARQARKRGLKAIIAGAGGAARGQHEHDPSLGDEGMQAFHGISAAAFRFAGDFPSGYYFKVKKRLSVT